MARVSGVRVTGALLPFPTPTKPTRSDPILRLGVREPWTSGALRSYVGCRKTSCYRSSDSDFCRGKSKASAIFGDAIAGLVVAPYNRMGPQFRPGHRAYPDLPSQPCGDVFETVSPQDRQCRLRDPTHRDADAVAQIQGGRSGSFLVSRPDAISSEGNLTRPKDDAVNMSPCRQTDQTPHPY